MYPFKYPMCPHGGPKFTVTSADNSIQIYCHFAYDVELFTNIPIFICALIRRVQVKKGLCPLFYILQEINNKFN